MYDEKNAKDKVIGKGGLGQIRGSALSASITCKWDFHQGRPMEEICLLEIVGFHREDGRSNKCLDLRHTLRVICYQDFVMNAIISENQRKGIRSKKNSNNSSESIYSYFQMNLNI